MRVVLTESPPLLDERAGELLRARLEHNVLASVLDTYLAEPRLEPPLFGFVEEDAGSVVAVAARLEPRLLLVSLMSEAAAAALAERWLLTDPALPGVAGPRSAARAFAAAWERLTGGTATVEMAQALHVLDRVTWPARSAPGAMRVARPDERALLVRWGDEFLRESGAAGDPESMIDIRLDAGLLHVWEDRGQAVSLVGSSRAVAGVVRIGPVYTPRELRGRGYASSAVATRSQVALDAGASRCMLHTDLANPTSNRIYAALGYRRVAEWEDVVFTPAAGTA